jgi:hypothetical protein
LKALQLRELKSVVTRSSPGFVALTHSVRVSECEMREKTPILGRTKPSAKRPSRPSKAFGTRLSFNSHREIQPRAQSESTAQFTEQNFFKPPLSFNGIQNNE